MKENQHRYRASRSCISAVLAGRCIKARKAFTTEIAEARKMMKMVEGYDGLLYFLLLGFGSGFTLIALKRFSDKGLETFRSTIARYESLMLLSEVGNEFLLSVWGEGEFKERLFQKRQLGELQNLPNEDLIKFLTPIQPEDGISLTMTCCPPLPTCICRRRLPCRSRARGCRERALVLQIRPRGTRGVA